MSLFSKSVRICQSRQLCFTSSRCYGKVGILGIPFDEGQRQKGVGSGPEAIRSLGLVKELGAMGIDVVDFGDVKYEEPNQSMMKEVVSNMRKLNHIAACHQQTSIKVKKILQDGYKCLCLGGDHSIAIGTIDGHLQAHENIGVLWIDAHADLNTAATSPSGNIHGMPVALLAKELAEYWPYLPGMDWLVPKLSIKNVAYIGLRDIDSYERLLIEKFNITAFGMDDVERLGIHEVIRRALERIDPKNDRSLHISFDVDGLDPIETPSTGTPVRGGLTLREGVQIVEDVFLTGRLRVVDMVEVNPKLGSASDVALTVGATKHLIKGAFGFNRRGLMTPDMMKDLPQFQNSRAGSQSSLLKPSLI